LLTDTADVIQGHPRLLRSLAWGDPDCDGLIHTFVPRLLGEERGDAFPPRPRAGGSRFPNLVLVEEFVGLEGWLRDHDPRLHTQLYIADAGTLDAVEKAGRDLSIDDLAVHVVRIRRTLSDDPATVIGSAKELLESVLKSILDLHGAGKDTHADIPEQLKQVRHRLDLDPRGVDSSEPGADTQRRILGALGTLVQGAAELRNQYGTGHGRSRGPQASPALARLAVAAATAAATYLLEVRQAQRDIEHPGGEVVGRGPKAKRVTRGSVRNGHARGGSGWVEPARDPRCLNAPSPGGCTGYGSARSGTRLPSRP
jgi:hypothetical protein